jgi:alpha-tubulin suppressor-like RCC1 family protein
MPSRAIVTSACLALLLIAGCGRSFKGTVQETCAGVSCSGNGNCFAQGGEPFCDCDEGFHPDLLACVADDALDPCNGVFCNAHGTCRVERGRPVCDCDPGYRRSGPSDLICFVDPGADAVEEADAADEVEPPDVDTGEDLPEADEIDDGAEDPEIPPLCGNGELNAGEECDDGRNGDPDDGCTDACAYSCHFDEDCSDAIPCTNDACDPFEHTCSNRLSEEGTVCRPAAETCDVPETCNGTDTTCPPDEQSCWTLVSAGTNHTCGITNAGALHCWGYNDHGMLGDGTTDGRTYPVRVGTDEDWFMVSAGGEHTCAVKEDKRLFCWGWNAHGQVGDGTNTERHAPVQVGTGPDWIYVSTGAAHTCGLKDTGTAYCWGLNNVGQLGVGSTPYSSNAPMLINVIWTWPWLDVGESHSCGVEPLADGGMSYCWGYNIYGQLGDGTKNDRSEPATVSHFSDAVYVTAGGGHTCAIVQGDGSIHPLFCWGNNRAGQLGVGPTPPDSSSFLRVGTDLDWAGASAGGMHTCARKEDRTLYCWGQNYSGQLGDGSTTGKDLPQQVGTDADWVQISAGQYHTCAVKTDGRLFCWGDNDAGQLGIGSDAPMAATPTLVTHM